MDFPTIVIALLVLVLLSLAVNSVIKWFKKKQLRDDIHSFLTEIDDDLDGFGRSLERYENHPNPVNGIVSFFQRMSRWHDQTERINDLIYRCGDLDVFLDTKVNLIELKRLIINTGRDKHGMNRTEANQSVTDNDVYLGDIHGLFTKSVSDLKGREEKLKSEKHPDVTINSEVVSAWQVYEEQARSFIKTNSKAILSKIDLSRVLNGCNSQS